MTQEDKELLLKDLSARLPYRVIVDIKYSKEAGSSDRLRICNEGYLVLNADLIGLFIEDEIHLKPYLRPMSSMTEGEKKEVHRLFTVLYDRNDVICGIQINSFAQLDKVTEWLNKHHFDYRGLIEKGLALEAPENMYKNK